MTVRTVAELKAAITPLVPASWTDVQLTDLIDSIFTAHRSWQPPHFVGTYDAGTEYVFGDAVRANAAGTWKLYISLIDANVGNDPTSDHLSWQDVIDDNESVTVAGTAVNGANPNTYGEANRITHYVQNATGGTFDLGMATGIAWDAVQAAIQAALDTAYGANTRIVTGDAADFTVEFYDTAFDSLDLDPTSLTGGGLVSQTDTQAQVRGGFVAPNGSLFIGGFDDFAVLWQYDDDEPGWMSNNTLVVNTGRSLNLRANRYLTRGGVGIGSAEGQFNAIREGAGDGDAISTVRCQRSDEGDGDARGGTTATRGGSGAGDARATNVAAVADTAVGAADARSEASHHAGGDMVMGPSADASGAYAEITGTLPTTDPVVAGHIWEFTGDITALTTYLAGGGKLLVRSAGT